VVEAEGRAMTAYEPVIGLEVHAQLLTKSKLFCGCSTAFGAPPNAHTCEVCLGMPGVLPVVNRHAVELAVRAALALGCTVHETSQWSRKNYFYPDLAKGYQISQFDRPIATGGELLFDAEGERRRVRLRRIHLEEDAGKNVHDEAIAGQRSAVDFNRGGTPLVEIVSEPEIRSAAEAAAYMKALRQLLRYLGVCDGNLEEGSLRCDANVSLRPAGSRALGTRTELKNINSFRFVQQAIDYEIARQRELLEAGGRVAQETRLWEAPAKRTRAMRSKEEAHDYRYFPDPDLPDLQLEAGLVESIRRSLPELPAAKLDRYKGELGLSDYDARVLTEEVWVARFFEGALATHNHPKAVANWVINEVLHDASEEKLTDAYAKQVGELVALIDEGTISGKMAKEMVAELAPGEAPRAFVERRGLRQVTDVQSLEAMVDAVLAANPESVAKFKAGKGNVAGFLVGQVMKQTGGKANPKMVSELVVKKLSG
jgi:aspartyl-tRNA(Asn)/glutamyl-tRNA(Gln) amidotransferase subunit B